MADTNLPPFHYDETGKNLYEIVTRLADGKVWRVSDSSWQTLAAAALDDCDKVISESAWTYWYAPVMPDGIAARGTYQITVFRRAGANPAASDLKVATAVCLWSGTAPIDEAGLVPDVLAGLLARPVGFVAKTGSDANDGRTPSAAKLTIAAALAAAASGDALIILPGTYAETLDGSAKNDIALRGSRAAIITSAAFATLTVGNGWQLGAEKIVNTGTDGSGSNWCVDANSADARDLSLEGTWLVSADAGVYAPVAGALFLTDCQIDAAEYCLACPTNPVDVWIVNSALHTSGWTACNSAAVSYNGAAGSACQILGSVISADVTNGDAAHRALAVSVGTEARVVVSRSRLSAIVTAGGHAYAAYSHAAGAKLSLRECALESSAPANAYDIYNGGGVIDVAACQYDRSKVYGSLVNVPVKLAPDGLDEISTTAPAGVAANFRQMLVQLWRRFFKKTVLATAAGSTTIKTYADDGATVVTTQTVAETSTSQTQGPAS